MRRRTAAAPRRVETRDVLPSKTMRADVGLDEAQDGSGRSSSCRSRICRPARASRRARSRTRRRRRRCTARRWREQTRRGREMPTRDPATSSSGAVAHAPRRRSRQRTQATVSGSRRRSSGGCRRARRCRRARAGSAARRCSRAAARRGSGPMPGIATSCTGSPAAPSRGTRLEQAARVGMQRAREQRRRPAASSTMRPAYMTATRSAISRDHAEIVGDEQHRRAELRAAARAAGRGSAPGS